MTAVDEAFVGAGTKAGTEIWRIENFKPVKLPEAEHGKFYMGDSYIILNTKQLRSGAFEWNIHFWIGKDTSQDEKGTAAIKSVELDDYLGGSPVQHRECQEYESSLFCSLFKGGIRYVPGGIKSGFKHYDPTTAPPRLFHVKGKRNVRVNEVEVSVRSMNKGDCFILDSPTTQIWVYVGRYSKRVERLKAIQAANQIRDQDHGGRVKIQIVDPNSSEETVDAFFKALGGGSRADMPDPPLDDDDATFEKQTENVVTLYRVSDVSGKVNVEKVAMKPLKGEMLKSEDSFVLDAGKSGIFVWIGKQCTSQEKTQAIATAEKFLVEKGYPDWTKIQRVVDGGEPTSFKQYFSVWREAEIIKPVYDKVYTLNRQSVAEAKPVTPSSTPPMTKQERAKLLKNLGTALGFCPDDGKGKVELWRIENFELAPVPAETHGLFFGGDSYVLQYTYKEGNREKYIIYFWQGNSSSQDEKTAAALHAVALDDKLCGRAVQVRVTQNHEPSHFLRIFKGRMIVFMGGHASGFRNVRNNDTYDPNKARLFHVRGTCDDDTRAIQVELAASSLNSDDTFVLDGPKEGVTYIWIGKHASAEEKAMAEKVDKIVSPDRNAIKIQEGAEPAEFWKLLGGKGNYTKDDVEDAPALAARLFHCFITPPSTKLETEEVFNFTQEDLNEDDVMVLDTGDDVIYMWVGKGASPQEKKDANRTIDEYIAKNHARAGANCVTISIVVKQHDEPDAFKAFFMSWDDDYWKNLQD